MTTKDEKPWSLEAAMALDDEIQDWNEYMGSKTIGIYHRINDAKSKKDYKRAEELDRERQQWLMVERAGYSRAEESELGKYALNEIRARRKRLNDFYASASLKERNREIK